MQDNTETGQERVYLLEQAQEKLSECIDLLEDAVGDNANAVAYLIDQLKTHLDDNHGFMCSNLTIGKLVDEYSNDAEYEG